jgi:hypothetical protein
MAAYRIQRPGRITAGLPDPRQRHQAIGQRRGVDELPAQRDALGDVSECHAEFVPLVGNLGQAHMGGTGRRQRWSAWHGGDL